MTSNVIILVDIDTNRLNQIEKLLQNSHIKVDKFTGLAQAIAAYENSEASVLKWLIHIAAIQPDIQKNIALLDYHQIDINSVELYVAKGEEKADLADTGALRIWHFLDEWNAFRQSLEEEQTSLPVYPEAMQGNKTIAKLDQLTSLLRPHLLFCAPKMRQALEMLPRMAQSHYSVFIGGETGTGKEMVARAIHSLSPQKSGPFIGLNCGAIPENLIESELFGHEKGAFTGAISNRKGKFALATNGTLFLDEIGDMPLALQARLLRVLEEKEYYPIGSETLTPFNARIIAATQVPLEQAVQDGLFREDLYYRLNILRIQIPSLRERKEDIPLLAWHFLERAFKETKRAKPYPRLSAQVVALLEQGRWQGNVRELRNVITRLAVLVPLKIRVITLEHMTQYFPEYFSSSMTSQKEDINDIDLAVETPRKKDLLYVSPNEANTADNIYTKNVRHDNMENGIFIPVGTSVDQAQKKLILATLKAQNGNKMQTANLLGISERTLRRKLDEITDIPFSTQD